MCKLSHEISLYHSSSFWSSLWLACWTQQTSAPAALHPVAASVWASPPLLGHKQKYEKKINYHFLWKNINFCQHFPIFFHCWFREVTKKQIFYGQADRKHLHPTPLRSACCDFLCIFDLILWLYVFWNGFYTRKVISMQLQEFPTPPLLCQKWSDRGVKGIKNAFLRPLKMRWNFLSIIESYVKIFTFA